MLSRNGTTGKTAAVDCTKRQLLCRYRLNLQLRFTYRICGQMPCPDHTLLQMLGRYRSRCQPAAVHCAGGQVKGFNGPLGQLKPGHCAFGQLFRCYSTVIQLLRLYGSFPKMHMLNRAG
ncbi:Uncharacterised protein [Mycobacterium tuberculosis]|nr:Uncharacterised protein [Mycobacterium tuberculosis]